jgi:predicted lipoprotein with Yx(FWY)xxD motif
MRTRFTAMALLGLAVLLAACGSGSVVGVTAAPATAAPATAAPATAAPTAAADGAAALALADNALGKIVVGDKGMTLYLFTPDTSAKSACTGDCLANWPALISDAAPTLGTGLDAEDFKTITRDDGSKQATFYGHPLYYFGGDKAAGDVAGQGLGGKWYVIKSDGTAVK